MNTLLLWDIDGTLITANGAGMNALRHAVFNGFGISNDLEHIELAGRTDRWIFRQILQSFKLPVTGANLELLEKHYLAALPSAIEERGVCLLPGIRHIIAETAQRPDVAQGLLTGNLRHGAQIKLTPTALWACFPFGAFADDSEDRNQLGPWALQRARAHHRVDFPIDRVWVIGDTPYDVACGNAIGAKTLALATGRHSVACLRDTTADAVIEDLSDISAFWSIVCPE